MQVGEIGTLYSGGFFLALSADAHTLSGLKYTSRRGDARVDPIVIAPEAVKRIVELPATHPARVYLEAECRTRKTHARL
jgi:hypothetical protein